MKSALNAIAIQLLPYPDPWQRWRMRRVARELITCSPWPGEAASPADIAQLALLRLLYLQREAHRTARSGGFEATMLLARASVDACISGLYWLEQPDAGARLTNANAKSAKQLLEVIMELLGVPTAGLDEAARLIGEPDDLPKLHRMAQDVANQSGVPLTKVMYAQIYMPLSFLFEHTTGVALQRHIDSTGRLLDAPEQWWTRRRALHTVDLCTGYLALTLARHATNPRVLEAYVQAHAKRVLVPAMTMFLQLARQAIHVRELPKLTQAVKSLRGASGAYGALTTDDERVAFAKDRIRQAVNQFNLFDDKDMQDQLLEILIRHLVHADIAEPKG